jgi:hypothetical protein
LNDRFGEIYCVGKRAMLRMRAISARALVAPA